MMGGIERQGKKCKQILTTTICITLVLIIDISIGYHSESITVANTEEIFGSLS